jgi:hypothetical protein
MVRMVMQSWPVLWTIGADASTQESVRESWVSHMHKRR